MQAGVAITSILVNNPGKDFCFHIFCDGVGDFNLEKMRQTAEKYHTQVIIYYMDMKPFQTFHIKTQHFSRVTYLRSVMPKILKPLTEKYLYMDADMVCTGDITEIENIDLEGYPLRQLVKLRKLLSIKLPFYIRKAASILMMA